MLLVKKAKYATDYKKTKGRLYPEKDSQHRNPFHRDKDRIIHSEHFRLLKHKTQVFIAHTEDYYRTRLTHSLEVSQIARTIARILNIDEDLSEVLALSHDLGHPPFSHSGEEVLDECMKSFGGFDHNVQTLKIITKLEKRYPDFDGLNLSWETLEGILKHNGPIKSYKLKSPIGFFISDYIKDHDLEVSTFPSLEAQIASLSDDIAYNNHDIDDGYRAGKFEIKDLCEIPIIESIYKKIIDEYSNINEFMIIQELVRRLIGFMVNDLVIQTKKNLKDLNPKDVTDIRKHIEPAACFSLEMQKQDMQLKKFLRKKVYTHKSMEKDRDKSKKIIKELFEQLLNNIELLPRDLQELCKNESKSSKAYIICDFIASMTDRSATANHAKVINNKEI
ncbi:MAG: deoxyguanosinetriphosphate triphosphohydrolase [Pseudomonadota bacterium]|nr:deoxyguanosinetriphosphate triphosphohydrolase [Pseudomonadota bacterium]